MIQVTFVRNRNGKYIGFDCSGHAGYAEAGKDIICAGVSALVINVVNSIGSFTDEKFSLDTDEDTGRISIRFQKPAGQEADLLIRSLLLGLQGIQESYDTGYVKINFKEV